MYVVSKSVYMLPISSQAATNGLTMREKCIDGSGFAATAIKHLLLAILFSNT